MYDIIGPYAGVYKWLYECAPFRQDLPDRPVDLLPYYHGRISCEVAAQRLCCTGDFLIYAQGEDEPTLTLLIRDKFSNPVEIDICCNYKGHFSIFPMDEEYEYSTVDALIRSHINLGTVFKKSTPPPPAQLDLYPFGASLLFCAPSKLSRSVTVRMEHAVRSPEFLSPIHSEGKINPTELKYFHEISAREAAEMMTNSGDFIVRRSETDAETIDLMVRWGKDVRTFHGLANTGNSVYPLFNRFPKAPVEHVHSLDDYLKSCVLCQQPIKGVLLKRPVFHDMANQMALEECGQAEGNGDALRTDEPDEMAVHKEPTMGAGLVHSLLNYCAPRPMSFLPYFHGRLDEEEAQALLHNDGDFLLFIDKSDDKLYVVLHKCREMVADWHYRELRVDQRNRAAFIRDKDQDLGYMTVDELIAYYRTYKVPIQPGAQWTNAEAENVELLQYPVTNCTSQKEIMLEVKTFLTNLDYYYKPLTDKQMTGLLVQEGDYLLRGTDYGETQLCVKWDGKVHKLPLPTCGYDGTYELPHIDSALPEEHTATLDGLLKTLVLCQIPYRGVVLRRALRKT